MNTAKWTEIDQRKTAFGSGIKEFLSNSFQIAMDYLHPYIPSSYTLELFLILFFGDGLDG